MADVALKKHSTNNFMLSYLFKGWQANRPLTILGVSMFMTLVFTLIAMVVDPKVITGRNAWVKPAKFAISISIYSFTLLWMLTFIKNRPRVVGFISWITVGGFISEMVAIIGQVMRGTTSHFNNSTPFDDFVYSWMSYAIVAIWLCCFFVGIFLLFQKLSDPAFAWSLRFGILIALIGMGVAFLMTLPTEQQRIQEEETGISLINGAHSVGVEDGGAGLPILGWSTEGGDLRVGHFVGLHGMQVLPLIGLLLSSSAVVHHIRREGRILLVFIAGISYLLLIILLTWQALRGQSITAPDDSTIALFVSLLVGTLLSIASTISLFKIRKA